MRRISTVVLAILLAAAIVLVLILYKNYVDTKEALRLSESQSRELRENLGQQKAEQTKLQEEMRAASERAAALAGANTRIAELERLVKEREDQLAEREAVLVQQKQRLTAAESQIQSLKEQAEKGQSEQADLRRQLSGLAEEKAGYEGKIKELKSACEARVSELETDARNKEARIAALSEDLKDHQSRVLSLEDALKKSQSEQAGVQREIAELRGKKTELEDAIGQQKQMYSGLVSDLKEQIEKKEVTLQAFQEKLSVTFVDRVLFDFASATITPQGKVILKKVGERLKKISNRALRIVGHTDDKPIRWDYQSKFPSNWELSAARAAAVARYFQDEVGLDPGKMEVAGRSFYQPIASNSTPEGRAKNRRVEMIIAPELGGR